MTRRDLQQVISDLEYLLRFHLDPAMREEYDKQLEAFRELLALQHEIEELTPVWESTWAA